MHSPIDSCVRRRSVWVFILLGWPVPTWAGNSLLAQAMEQPSVLALGIGLGLMTLMLVFGIRWLGRQIRGGAGNPGPETDPRERLARDLPIGLHEVVETAPKGPRFLYVSDRALDLWGISRREAELDLYNAFRNVHPADRDRLIAVHEQARIAGAPLSLEARFVVEGRQRWLRIDSWPRRIDGQLSWPGYTQDVTDRHEAEAKFRLLFEQSPVSVMVHESESGDLIDANRAAWEAYGLQSLEELQAYSFWNEPPYSPAEALAYIRKAAKGESQRFEWRSIKANGQPFWELVSLMPVVIDGRLRVFSAGIEITELRETEQRLKEREGLLRAMSQLADVGGWSVELATGELNWTEQTFHLHNLPLDSDLSVTDALSFYHHEDRPVLEQALARAREHGETFDLTLRLITATGQERLTRSQCRPVEQGGRVVRLVGAIQDITGPAEAERRFRALFEQSPVAILVQDAVSGELLDANRQGWEGYGYASFEALKAAESRVWADQDQGAEYNGAAALKRLRRAMQRHGDRFEWPSRHADGRILWHDVTLTPVTLSGRACALAVCVDITQRREAEQRLRESEERFRRILQDVDGVSVQGYHADGSVHYWNRASEALYGYTEAEALGSNLLDLIIPPEMRDGVRAGLQGVAEGGSIPNGELELKRKDGRRVPVYSSHTVVRRPGEEPELFCIDIDLTERKAHEQALERMANYDVLTGLPNRRLMAGMLEQMIARAARAQSAFALCYLDLDDFKPINDQHGHETGDRMLVAIGQRLRRLVRGSDLVGRLGGDEFVLALDGVGDGPELERRLRFILDGVAQPVHFDGLQLQVHGSIGVTLYPQDNADPDTLLRHADQAMYRSKAQGRNQFSLFDTEIEARVSKQRQRLSEIETGLDQGQFRLHYQPKMELASGEVAGFEALVRWHHPERGVLAPLAFLPVLERSSLENRFGEHVIEQALEQMEQWLDVGLDLTISVNVSGPHLLSEGFVAMIEKRLGQHPSVPPQQLELEIVESAAVTDLDCAVHVLTQLRDLGLRVSLDDFGTGFSSLSHLRSLPVDEVKIDQSFVRDMLTDLNDYNIVRSVIGLADAFNLRVVAEGVETEEHAAELRRLGCQLVQGYAFSRPMPAEQVQEWLAARTPGR